MPLPLDLNQELELRKIQLELPKMTNEELQHYALYLAKKFMEQQNAIKDLYKAMGIDGVLYVESDN